MCVSECVRGERVCVCARRELCVIGVYVCVCVCMYLCVHVCVFRERERE